MIRIEKNVSLKSYNSFGIDVNARQFILFDETQDLKEVSLLMKQGRYLILGGGSNVLFTKDVDGSVIMAGLKMVDVIHRRNGFVLMDVYAGNNWDEFVAFCVENNYGGIENLSYIPGNVGAAPIQNIGAYGVEVKDVIEEVTYFDIKAGKIKTLAASHCKFQYRNSVFKNELKGNFIILSVRFKLSTGNHTLNVNYAPVKEKLGNSKNVDLSMVRETIIDIRKSKLPEPSQTGNAGSFFKNPIIAQGQFNSLLTRFKEIPHYRGNDEMVKIPAAWLIENAGWKGLIRGNVGVHAMQPLVLINASGNAKGIEVLELAENIISDIYNKFGIRLEKEVNIIQ